MLIIIDKKIPQEAKNKLREFGELLELQTSGITYEAISGHPDIFFHDTGKDLIVAPNLPHEYLSILDKKKIKYVLGEQPVGAKYPDSSAYNAVSVGNLLIHNFRNTDSVITSLQEDADLIHVDQGYTRCNILALDEAHFITSDEKIKRVLDRFDKDCLYVSPEGINLPGFRHGFFGGCCGLAGKKVFISGSLKHYHDGKKTEDYLLANGFEIIELYGGQLFDGGSILYVGNA